MRRAPLLLIVMYGLIAVGARTVPQQPADQRDVTVTVRFVTHDGRALEDWPFALVHRVAVWNNDVILDYGRTNEEGEVVLHAKVAEDVDRLFVEFSQWRTKEGPTKLSVQKRDMQRLQALQERYHFPFNHLGFGRVELDGKVVEEELVVTAEPGLVIRGRLVDERGEPMTNGAVMSAPGPVLGRASRKNGVFVLRGVPKRPHLEIFVNTHPGVVIIPVQIPPDAHAVDVGDIQIVPPEVSCRTELLITGFGPLNQKRRLEIGALSLVIGGASLISRDGEHIFSYPNHENGAVNNDLDRDIPTASCGQFYVIPGRFDGHDLYMSILEAIAAGVDPTEFGVPLIELEEGKVPVFTFNALEIADAIGRLQEHLDTKRSEAEEHDE